jgi:hypothetical protein
MTRPASRRSRPQRPSYCTTAGTASRHADPPSRAITAAAGLHPVLISAEPNIPDVPKVPADSTARAMPAAAVPGRALPFPESVTARHRGGRLPRASRSLPMQSSPCERTPPGETTGPISAQIQRHLSQTCRSRHYSRAPADIGSPASSHTDDTRPAWPPIGRAPGTASEGTPLRRQGQADAALAEVGVPTRLAAGADCDVTRSGE